MEYMSGLSTVIAVIFCHILIFEIEKYIIKALCGFMWIYVDLCEFM
jgi:hypothetical protein